MRPFFGREVPSPHRGRFLPGQQLHFILVQLRPASGIADAEHCTPGCRDAMYAPPSEYCIAHGRRTGDGPGVRRENGIKSQRFGLSMRPVQGALAARCELDPPSTRLHTVPRGAQSDSTVNRRGSARLGCLKFLVRPSIEVCETLPRRSARRRPKCCISAVSGTLALI